MEDIFFIDFRKRKESWGEGEREREERDTYIHWLPLLLAPTRDGTRDLFGVRDDSQPTEPPGRAQISFALKFVISSIIYFIGKS